MSQELIYTVKAVKDPQSFKQIKDELNQIQQGAQQPRRNGGSKAAQEIKELDELTKKYREQSTELARLRAQTNEYRLSLRQLNSIRKEQGELTDEQLRDEAALRSALKDTESDYRAQERAIIATVQATEIAGNSYNEVSARMRALSAEIRNMQDPLGANKEEVARLTAEYNRLNNQLKEVDGAMGNHQRNVGNYENSIRSAANAIAVFQGPLGPLAGRLNSLATVFSRLTNAKKANATAAVTLGSSIRTALIASGIGLLIIALSSLMKFFTRTEEGQQKLRVIMAALGAVFNTLGERAISLGKGLVEAFESPKDTLAKFFGMFDGLRNIISAAFTDPVDTIKSFGSFIASQLITRAQSVMNAFRAVGDGIMAVFKRDWDAVKQAGKDLGTAVAEGLTGVPGIVEKVSNTVVDLYGNISERVREFSDEIRQNVNESVELQKAMNAVLLTERELGVERAKMNANMAEARERSRDLSVSFQERLRLLKEVSEAEEEIFSRELENERERLRIMTLQNDMFSSTAEQNQAIADQEAKIAELERESAIRKMSLLRDTNAVERQQREFNARERRLDFEQAELEREHSLNEELRIMRRGGDLIRAAELERDQLLKKELKEARIRFRQEELEDLGFKDAEDRARAQVELEIAMELAEAENEIFDLRRKNFENLMNAYVDITKNSMSVLFGDNKAVQVAGAIIDTYAAATSALGMKPYTPLNFAQAAAVVTAGMANVRRILATNIGSKSTSASTPSAPSISEQFRLIDPADNEARLLAELSSAQTGRGEATTINLNVIDSEDLADRVREGNNALSSRGITIRTGT